MPSFFLSHATVDRDAAKRIGDRLRQRGFSFYLSSDPEHGPAAGAKWEEDIYEQLHHADAVIFVASKASVESKWCFAELALARSEGKLVIPILVGDEVRHPLIDDTQWIKLRYGEDAFEQLWEGIRRAGIDPSLELNWDPTRPPYPGLEAFQPGDAAVFFGRQAEVADLVERVRAKGRGRLVTVVGASGTGKSSLVLAGIVPRLERERDGWVIVPPLVPGPDPVEDLARVLAVAFAAVGREEDWRRVKERLCRAPGVLVELARDLSDAHGGSTRSVLLVVDQAEALLTHAGDAARAQFVRIIEDGLEAPTPLRVIATLRSEFLARASEGEAIVDRNELFLLGPLDRSRLPEVVEGPARQARIVFDSGLVGRIVDDTRGGDALPLLAYTLQQLYNKADRTGGGRRFTHELYDRLGGVAGALTRAADEVNAELVERGKDSAVLATLLKLVTVDAEGEVTRRRVRRDELSDIERGVVHWFVEHRLLKTDRLDDATVVVEIVHEALLREWRPLREEVERSRERLRVISELERLSRDWNMAGRADSYLLRGNRLARAREVLAAGGGRDPTHMREFIEASVNQQRAALERESDLLAKRSLSVYQEDPELALLLGLAAVEEYAPTSAAILALNTALASSKLRGRLRGHASSVRSAAYSPDGSRIATGSHDGTVRIWDAGSSAVIQVLRGHEGGVWSVAYSPDGSRIVTGSTDGTARVWQTATGTELQVLRGHQGSRPLFETVLSVAYSPDGSRIVTGSGDQTARVWDAASGVRLHILRGHENSVASVAYSPDGSRIVTASHDRTARIWDAASGAELKVLRGHEGQLWSVAYSPDGGRIVTGSDDGTAGVWDAASGAVLQVLRGHEGAILSVGYSPDGSHIVTGSGGGTTSIWEPASDEVQVLRGHEGSVGCVAYSPDGSGIVTGSADGTVRVWEAAKGVQLQALPGDADVWSVACSPDGTRIITGSYDGRTARLWDAASGAELQVLHRDESWVVSIAYSPDGTRIVTGSHDGTVRIHDAGSVTERQVLRGHEGGVWSIAYSPDGSRILTGSGDRTARIWDTVSGAELKILYGHTGAVWSVAYSPDGGRIVTGSDDGTACVWDAVSGDVLQILRGHADAVNSVACSPDGKRIITGSFDYTARIFDAKSGDVLQILRGHTGAVASVACSPDGKRIVTGSWDGTARVWEHLTLEELVAKAKTRVFRSLTAQERTAYGLPGAGSAD